MLELIREKMQQGEYAKVYQLCDEKLSDLVEAIDTLTPDERQECAWLRISALIHLVPMADFFEDIAEDEDGDEYFVWNSEYDDIVELYKDALLNATLFFDGDKKKQLEDLFQRACAEIKQCALNRAEELLPQIDCNNMDVVEFMSTCALSCNCLGWITLMWFGRLQEVMGIEEDCDFPSDEIMSVGGMIDDALYVYNEVAYQTVVALADDFPYFADVDVGTIINSFVLTRMLVEHGIDKEPETAAQKRANCVRLKRAVAVRCDMLNAIAVCDGIRISIFVDQDDRNKIWNEIQEYTAQIREVYPDYAPPQANRESYNSVKEVQKNGGCYVATAVYGSYDCPEVWTLRRYRDHTLAETWYGRAFIKTYYAISPTLVKWFGHTAWFKKMWRGKLDRIVWNLQSKGVESTPYEDRMW